jgi:hypothetical protein
MVTQPLDVEALLAELDNPRASSPT